jgi:hypothetical protein
MRSVHRERAGRVIEPRKRFDLYGADVVSEAEGSIAYSDKARSERSGGVEERGMYARVLQEPGRSRALHSKKSCGSGAARKKWSRPSEGGVHARWERTERRRVELLSEGNEARRGGENSEPLNSTEEVGELAPGDPMEGRRRLVYGTP